jgi:hypothetical protein
MTRSFNRLFAKKAALELIPALHFSKPLLTQLFIASRTVHTAQFQR